MRLLNDLWFDLRLTPRMLSRGPWFTAVAIATLALGIGTNVAVFSVVNTVLLRPVDAPDPDEIFVFGTARQDLPPAGASPTRFNAWKELDDLFDNISGYTFGQMNLTGVEVPEHVRVGQVSHEYFNLFGIPIVLGRGFRAEEDLPHAGGFAVISEALWHRAFASSPEILGQAILLGGDPHEIIGVARTDAQADVWVPLQIDPASESQAHFFTAAGRIRPGVTSDIVEHRLELLSNAFERKYPQVGAGLGGSAFVVQPIQEVVGRSIRYPLMVLSGAVALVLLIACANVANLLLARGTVRQGEIAIRAGLGAGRGRLVRQLLTEYAVLWSIGAVVGLGLGVAGIRALLSLSPVLIPRAGEDLANLYPDWRVVLFTVLVTLLTGVAFGLLPAWLSSRTNPSAAIKGSGFGQRASRTQSALVVAEVAIALTLVVGCGLLLRTFIAMRAVEPGFDPRNVLTLQMTLTGQQFKRTDAVVELMQRTTRRISGIPGVEAVTAGCCLPVGTGAPNSSFQIAGRELDDAPAPRAMVPPTMPGYFEVAKIPLLEGRTFNEFDQADSPPVAVISKVLADKYWPNGDAIGSRIGIGQQSSPQEIEIVGVVGNVRYRGDGQAIPSIYVPFAQMSDEATGYMTRRPQSWMVGTRAESGELTAAIRNELQAESGFPVVAVRPLGELLKDSTAQEDFNLTLMLIFGVSALLLAAVGVYGLMAYSVRLRQKEIGVRQAIGATASDVRRTILARALRLAAVGLAVGTVAALALADVMAGFLFGVEARDPAVFLAAPAVLAGVALLAAWLPALRASRVDPLAALRDE